MTWDCSTIDKMEETAQDTADGSANRRINGIWLEVRWNGTAFVYLFKEKPVSREVATKMLEGVQP